MSHYSVLYYYFMFYSFPVPHTHFIVSCQLHVEKDTTNIQHWIIKKKQTEQNETKQNKTTPQTNKKTKPGTRAKHGSLRFSGG